MEPESTQQALEMLKTLMGIGNGLPSSSYVQYPNSLTDSYDGLLAQISKHNTYNTYNTYRVEPEDYIGDLGAAIMTASDIIGRFYDVDDQPESYKHAAMRNENYERYGVEWLLRAVNKPKELSWPLNRMPLPNRAYVRDMFVVNFDMMHAIDMNLRIMSASRSKLKGLGKSTLAFRDEDGVIYKMLMMETKMKFQDRVIPFIYYNNYLTQEGVRVDVYIAPQDCAPEIDGWQLHIHPTTDTIKVGNTKPVRL